MQLNTGKCHKVGKCLRKGTTVRNIFKYGTPSLLPASPNSQRKAQVQICNCFNCAFLVYSHRKNDPFVCTWYLCSTSYNIAQLLIR